MIVVVCFFLFEAEDGIRYLVRSRGLGDVYKRQALISSNGPQTATLFEKVGASWVEKNDLVASDGQSLSLIHI